MCGRFRQVRDAETLEASAGTSKWVNQERFIGAINVKPTNQAPVVLNRTAAAKGGAQHQPTQRPAEDDQTKESAQRDDAGETNTHDTDDKNSEKAAPQRTLQVMRWGLIPSWTRDPKELPTPMFNARGESITQRPAFRTPLQHGKRCVVVTDGFYEWYKGRDPKYANPNGQASQPYWVTHVRRNGDAEGKEEASGVPTMKMAGLYDRWHDADGEEVYTFTILTIHPSEGFEWLHNRMPVILSDDGAERWLDTANVSAEEAVTELVRPFDAELNYQRMESSLDAPLSDTPSSKTPDIKSFFNKKPNKAHEEGDKDGGEAPEEKEARPERKRTAEKEEPQGESEVADATEAGKDEIKPPPSAKRQAKAEPQKEKADKGGEERPQRMTTRQSQQRLDAFLSG